MSRIKVAIILCAGSGKRMMPFTNFYPKSFLPIKNKIALELVVVEAVQSGVKEIVFVHNQKDKFVRKFALWFNKAYCENIKFSFCEQREKNGSGGALMLCEKFASKPFFLAFADDITRARVPVLKQLEKSFWTSRKCIIGVRMVDKLQAKNYGILKPSCLKNGFVKFCEIVEKPLLPFEVNYANFGRYVLTPEIFDALKKVKEENGEVYLTKALEILAKQNKVLGFRFKGKCYDVGTMENYISAFKGY